MKTATVGDIVAMLRKQEPGKPCKVWLPGTTISLGGVIVRHDVVCIEGNIDPGSALDPLMGDPKDGLS